MFRAGSPLLKLLALALLLAVVFQVLPTSGSVSTVTVANDGQVGSSSLGSPSMSTAGGQKLVQDSYGKMIAIYVDSSGKLALRYANSNPVNPASWSNKYTTNDPVPYAYPAGVLVNSTSLRIIAQGGILGGDIVDIPVTIQRGLGQNITSLAIGSATFLDPSPFENYPTAILTHTGDILAAWNWLNTSNSSRVKALRWNHLTNVWTNFAGSSSSPDNPIIDLSSRVAIFPSLIERLDNFNVYVIGNRDNSGPSNLVFNKASFNAASSNWAWGTSNLNFETDAAHGIEDALSFAWDSVKNLVVASYGRTGAAQYNVFTIGSSSDAPTRLDTPTLPVSSGNYGIMAVNQTNGDYFIFFLSANPDRATGSIVYIRSPNGSSNWNTTLTVIDSDPNNRGLSLRRVGTNNYFDLLYENGQTNPVTIHLARVSTQPQPPTPSFTFTPPAPLPNQAITFNGTASGGTPPYTSFSWNFGDGTTGSGTSVIHTYTKVGTYTVQLTVTDQVGKTATGQNVVIVASLRLTFDAAGDWDMNSATLANWNSIANSGANFVIPVGDLLYNIPTPTQNEATWCSQFKGSNPNVELLVGNHETRETNVTGGGGSINKFIQYCPFTLGSYTGTYGFQYYFDYPSTNPLARFILVDPGIWLGNASSTAVSYANGSPAQSWVGSAIDDAHAKGISWVIVGMHKVCLSTGMQGCEISQDFLTFLISKKVDLVLQGHDHDYQRSKELTCATHGTYLPSCVVNTGPSYLKGAGTIFLIDGTGGNGGGMIMTTPDSQYFASADATTNGYMKYVVTSNSIQAQFVGTSGGSFADSWTISTADQPPIVSFTQNTLTGIKGRTTITLTITASDPDGAVSSARVDWGDGTVDTFVGVPATDSRVYISGGTFNIRVTVFDNVGLTGSQVSTVTITDLPPTAKFTETPTTAPTATSISFDASGSYDPDGTIVSYSWNLGDGTAATVVKPSHSYSLAGIYNVTLTVTDDGGLTATNSTMMTITDRPPSVSFTESATTVPTATSITLTISASDPDGTVSSLKVVWGDGTVDSLPGTAATDSHAYSLAGSYNVYVNATDNSGSTTRSSVATKIITDRPPVVSFTESATTGTTATSFTLTITASDPDGTVASLKVVWGDGTIDTLPGAATSDSHSYASTGNAPSASFNVYVNATDNSGSTTKSAVATKTVTDRAPTVSFTESATTVNTGQSIILTITSSDPDGTVTSLKVVWGDGTIDTLAGTATGDSHAYANTGNALTAQFTVYVNATDNSGSTTKSTSATKTVSDRPPSVSFTENTTTATTGQTITLTITANDPDGTLAGLKVSWGDGTIDTLAGTATTDSHSYPSVGNAQSATFSVYVNATDNSGSTSKSFTATKTIVDRPPGVTFTETTTTAQVFQTITLSVTSSDPDGTVASLKVSWGDGTVDTLAGTATTESHSYALAGSYTVYVNATDNSGQTTKSTTSTKTVTALKPPSVSFSESTTTALTGQTITLTISASDPNTGGSITSIKVSWGDGTVDTLPGTATTDSHAYSSTGSTPTATFQVYANATDNFGLTGQSTKATKTISDRPPTVSFAESATNAPTGTSITLTITAADPDGTVTGLKVSWGDGTVDTLAGTATTDSHSYAVAGTFSVYVNATDNAALTTKSPVATKTITDRPPTVSFTESLTTATTGQTITLTITAADPDGTVSSLKVVWGDGTIDTLAGTATSDSHAYANTGNLKQQVFMVYVNATDNSGSTTKSASASKTINDRPPTVSFTENTTSGTTTTVITLTITATDPDGTVASFKVVWGDGTIDALAGTATSDSHTYATANTFTVYVNATDNSGQTTKSATASKVISTNPIIVTFTENTTTGTTGQTITLTISASEAGGTISSLKIVWGDGTIDTLAGTATSDSHAYANTGNALFATFDVYVNATDNSGSTTKSTVATKTVTDRAPTVSFTETLTTANTGQAITLTITAADPDGTVSSLKVSWGDGTVDTLAGTATSDSHAYANTGNAKSQVFTVYVNATDNSGSTTMSAAATKTITDRPPFVSFTESTTTAPTGTAITLTITSSDPDGTVSSLKVVWGDGTIDTLAGTATTDIHAYASTGSSPTATFQVYVNATDNSGSTTKSAVATKTISDRAPTVSFTESATTTSTGTPITLTITSADLDGTDASLKVSWGDGTVDTLAGTATTDSHSYSAAGGFSVYVNATDNSGVTTKSSVATKTIQGAISVSFTESTTSAPTGTSITLTITASVSGGTISSLKVVWGDGTIDTLAGTATSDSHAYASTGSTPTAQFSVYVNATDNLGRNQKSSTALKTISDRAPTVSFAETATSAPTGTSITLTITATDPDGTVASLKVVWGDGTIDTLAGTVTSDSHAYANTGNSLTQQFTVYVNATDNSGSATKSASAIKTISDRAPTVSFTETLTTANTGQTITLTITSADPDGTVNSLKVIWGDGTIDTLAGTATSDSHAYASTGSTPTAQFTVYVNATDNSAVTTKSASAPKTISDRPPTVSFTENLTSATTTQAITLTITSADPDGSVSSLKVVWGDGTIDTLAGTTTSDSHTYATANTYTVYVNATDNSGSITKSALATKTVNDLPPTISFTESTTNAQTGVSITLTITAADPDGSVSSLTVSWGDGTVNTLAGTATTDSHAYTVEGVYTVYVNATDNAGLTTKSSTASKTITDRPPTVSFTESATNVPTGTSITLTITAADPDGTVNSLKVSWGDGTVDTLAGTATTDSHSYASTGSVNVATFNVYVNATDNSGSTTKSTVATKTVNDRPPTVSFTESTTTAQVGVSITLTITSADPDGTVTTLIVSWGDGTVDTLAGTATSDAHAYSTANTYSVYVNATDNSGSTTKSATATKTVTTRNPPTVSFTESTTTALTQVSIALTITATDPNMGGSISSIKVVWGDGTIDTLAGAATSDAHAYASTGSTPTATFQVYVNATDNFGLTGQSSKATKTITDRTPTVSFTESATNVPTGTSITLTVTVADPDGTVASLKVFWGDGTVDTLVGTATSDSHSYASTGSATSATFSVYVNATDNSGSTTKSKVATKTVTDRAPTVSFTESATVVNTGQSITLTITAADPDGSVGSLKVSWGDGTVDTLAGTATTDSHVYSSAGTFTVYVNATDNSGSVTQSASASKTITTPTINVSFTENTTTATTGQTITLTITASESGGTITSLKVVWGDGTIDILAGTATTDSHAYATTGASKTATFSVYVNATDNLGQTTKSSTATKIITDRPPTVSFSESATTAPTGTPISLTIASADPDGTVSSLKVVWGDGTIDTLAGTATTYSHAYTVAGTYSVYVNATDNSGSTTKSSVATKIITDRAPVVSFTESATNVPTGTSITVIITATDPDGTVSSVKVVWGDGTVDTLAGTATTDSHPYAAAGSFIVYVNATDNAGSTTKSASAIKTINDRPPVAVFFYTPNSSSTSVEGRTFIFNGTSSTDPDGTVLSYFWSFGDGTTGTGSATSHQYTVHGSYSVNLTVTDNSGNKGNATTILNVGADTVPPNWLPNASLTNIRPSTNLTSLLLSWTPPANDDGAIQFYNIFKNNTSIGNVPGTINTYNVTGLTPATYTFRIEAVDYAGLSSTNGPTATFVVHRLAGDVNNDCKVDISDLVLVAASFGTSMGSPGFNPAADLNGDGKITISDLVIVASNFGRHC